MTVEITKEHIKKIKEAFKRKGTSEVHIKTEDGKPVILAVSKEKI